ncbi:stage II sporulation protein P [Paenibacillus alginolyticus]|uniref:Stage II sporulation protein P n=1 Tax=Paenibacillus alginolyticus TaxID=59839 RepID=A0ABT4GB81_9BACL|nr:stage II sporulation protein P [Paenibacillus alginolyticus]MCY9693384.1 stage II sporulation protein P [Paenibacillus alginolyticus]MEC0144643.1 stage II sporulation protein P [Paenibacillus alginolyticus]
MKSINTAVETNKIIRFFQDLGTLTRIYLLLSFITFSVVFIIGALMHLQNKISIAPLSTINGTAATVPTTVFLDMMTTQIPVLEEAPTSTLSQKNISKFLFQILSGINPNNPKSLVALAIPGMERETPSLLYGGDAASSISPVEYNPPANVFQQGEIPSTTEESPPPVASEPTPINQLDENKGSKSVFIYHSHNRESWIPELTKVTNPDLAFDATKNVTLLGKRMKESFDKLGISATHSNKDYPSSVKDFTYPKSYQYSKLTVKEAFAANPKLSYLFDIHRDSQGRSKTTVTINKKDYAQIYFVVGEKNPNWEKNMEFAKKIHDKINEKYPGISRGIYGKNSNGNGEYNQSFSPNSSLIEIGGVENTLVESYRTIDILVEIIADVLKDAEKV